MVRERKKPKTKGLFDAETMKEGVKLVLEGQSVRNAADQLGLKFQTLARYVKKIRNDPNGEVDMKARCDVRKVFTDQQEQDLENFLIDNSKMFYGLTTTETRKLAFEMAEVNQINYPHNWKHSRMAGKDWLYGFMKRHPSLSLRATEGCSVARVMGFNRHNVGMFFENYETVLSKHPELNDPSRIWNLDETKTETNQQTSRVIAQKGIKQVCKAVSGERGTLVTTALIINAAGNTIPPAMVFPRVHFKSHMIQGAPAGTLGLAHPTGWMNSSNFVHLIKHFINYSGCSMTRQMLLICDNHESHISIKAINLAKANGVHILTFPPHCTHRMQPLDVGIMKPFQTFYNSAVDIWMSSNPGLTFTIYNVASCVGIAHGRAMVPQSILNAFRKTGIYPKDKEVYTDDMFLASSVTDKPLELSQREQSNTMPIASAMLQSSPILEPTANRPRPTQTPVEPSTSGTSYSIDNQVRPSPTASNICAPTTYVSPQQFRGYPKVKPTEKRRKPRAKGKSSIITSTPEKNKLEENFRKKAELLKEKEERLQKKEEKMEDKKKEQQIAKETKKKLTKRKIQFEESEEETEDEWNFDDGLDDGEEEDVEDNVTKMKVADFALVKFLSDKKIVHYVGKVVNKCDDGDLMISFLRKSSKSTDKFYYPIVEDIGSVPLSDIVRTLPAPNESGKTKRQQSLLSFAVSLSKYNVH